METNEYTVDSLHSTLSNASKELAELFWDVSRGLQLRKPKDEKYCPVAILVVLRQQAEVFAARIDRIKKNQTEELVHFKNYDEDELFSKINLDEETSKFNLQKFMKARSELLNYVSFLEKEAWNKKVAIHENLGELTIFELLVPLARRETEYINKLHELIDEKLLETKLYDVNKVHSILSNTSIALAELFWDIPREKQLEKYENEKWNALQIIIHLRQVAEIFTARIIRIMKRENEELIKLKDYNEDELMHKINLEEETVKSNLTRFMEVRSELLNKISFLEEEAWNKKVAIHEEQGELTLLQLLIPLAQREEIYLNKLMNFFDLTL